MTTVLYPYELAHLVQVVTDRQAGTPREGRQALLRQWWQAVGVERSERYCEPIVERLAQGALDFEGTA
jgi:hypothetical protein